MIQLGTPEDSNRRLQLIAVLTAVALWIFVALLPRIDTDKRKLTVPIQLHHAPEAVFLRASPQEAEVTIEGPRGAVGKLGEGDVEVFADLRGERPAPGRLVTLQVTGPSGMRWEVSPMSIRVIAP